MSLPTHLDPNAGNSRLVGQHPETGRWFIKLGQPGFNCRVNNGIGFVDEKAALDSIRALRRVAAVAALKAEE